jgi:transcription antitermination factor NusG
MLTLQENNGIRIADKRENIEAALDQLAYVAMQWIPNVYKREKVIRLLNNSVVINQIMGVNSVADMPYDVRVESGSMMPTNKAAKAQMLERVSLMALQAGDPIGSALLREMIKNMEIENVDEMLEQSDMVSMLQGQIQQLEGKLNEVVGDNQTMQRSLVEAKVNLQVEKATSSVDRIVDKANMATELAKSKYDLINREHQTALRAERKTQKQK